MSRKKKEKSGASQEGQAEEDSNNRISLRNFQLKPTMHINKLPLILTRYNKPIAIITSI